DEPRRTWPNMFCWFDEFGLHGLTTRACCVEMRARPSFVSVEACRWTECRLGTANAAGVLSTVGGCAYSSGLIVCSSGGFDSTCEPPSAKICSSDATPPPDDVGVPPDVSAMYSLPSTE